MEVDGFLRSITAPNNVRIVFTLMCHRVLPGIIKKSLI